MGVGVGQETQVEVLEDGARGLDQSCTVEVVRHNGIVTFLYTAQVTKFAKDEQKRKKLTRTDFRDFGQRDQKGSTEIVKTKGETG